MTAAIETGKFLLDSAAECFKNSPALIAGTAELNYNEYKAKVEETSERLSVIGIQGPKKIAVLSENTLEYVVLIMALIRNGAIVTPLSTYLTKNQISEYLHNIDCNTLLNSSDFARDSFDKIHTYEMDKIIKNSRSGARRSLPYSGSLEHEATILFTSGSTGEPKAVAHTLANHYYSALGAHENIPFQPGDRWLLTLPLYHVGGLAILFRAAVGGGAVVIPGAGETITRMVKRTKCTHLSFVATQLYRLVNDERPVNELRKVKAVVLGGSAIPETLIQKGIELGLPLYVSYGSTEMASQITTTGKNDLPGRLFISGRPLKYRQLKIADDGEIMVRGETLSKGYVLDGTIQSHVSGQGWFKTGDTGEIRDGYVTVTGRKDTMFISGGENIHPEEIERRLLSIDGVAHAVVVPVHSEEFGHRPVAFLIMEPGRPLNERSIKNKLRPVLPKFKIPVAFYSLPCTGAKISINHDRRKLRKIGESLWKRKDGIVKGY
jgi:O-succinylbenzoic acid--CoA ligase